MTLTEAFRAYGPCVGDPVADAQRSEAAAVLSAEVDRIVASLGSRGPHQELYAEAGQIVLLRLLKRQAKASDPTTDAEVRNYCARAIRNNFNSLVRRERAGKSVDDTGVVPPTEVVPPGSAEEEAERRTRELREKFKELQRQLEKLVADTAGRIRTGAGQREFTATFELLGKIARGEMDVTAVVSEWLRQDGHDAAEAGVVGRYRNRLYKRAQRTLERILVAIDAMVAADPRRVDRGESMKRAVDRLRLQAPRDATVRIAQGRPSRGQGTQRRNPRTGARR